MTTDELDILQTEYPEISIEEWYEVMDISQEDKDKRIDLARKLNEVFAWMMSYVAMCLLLGDEIERDYLVASLLIRVGDVVPRQTDYISRQIKKFTGDVVDTTMEHLNEAYYVSPERQSIIAVNEANTLCTADEMTEAYDNGYTMKTWVTERDSHVRKTHREVEGKTIPIDDYFEVGNSRLLFPGDELNGDVEEIANCRCSLKYS